MTTTAIVVVGVVVLIAAGVLVAAVRGVLDGRLGLFEIRLLGLLRISVRAPEPTDAGSTQSHLQEYRIGPHSQN